MRSSKNGASGPKVETTFGTRPMLIRSRRACRAEFNCFRVTGCELIAPSPLRGGIEGGRPLVALCSSKSKRLKIPRARRPPALPLHHTHRAGLPSHLPRPLQARGRKADGPQGVGSLTTRIRNACTRHGIRPTAVMAGLVPAIPIRRATRSPNRDHRHKAGDDVGGYQECC